MKISLSKRFLVSIVILTMMLGPIIPQKAEAQWVVFDPGNFANTLANVVKDWGLDTIGWMAANAVIQRISAATVNWINSGFKGSPAYITDPEGFFGNLADGIAGQAIYNNPNFQYMCSDIRSQVQLAVNRSYNQPYGNNFQCTLTGVVDNLDDFVNDFSQGGWNGFVRVSQNSQNNPIGLYLNWNNQVNLKVNAGVTRQMTELIQGSGFMSWKKCNVAEFTAQNIQQLEAAGLARPGLYKPGDCPGLMETQTPGSTIQKQLDKVLGGGQSKLEVADELNEIIGALINQLVGRVVGGIGSGLRGASRPDPGNGGRTYTSDLYNDSSTQAPINDGSSNLDQSVIDRVTSGIPIPPTPQNTLTPCQLPDGTIGAVGPSGTCQVSVTGGGNSNFTPIVASDGSTITGMPTDTDCQSASFDSIVDRASAIYYGGLGTPGASIADIVQDMDCAPGGGLP